MIMRNEHRHYSARRKAALLLNLAHSQTYNSAARAFSDDRWPYSINSLVTLFSSSISSRLVLKFKWKAMNEVQ